jgi:acetoin utilization protein AcuB
MPLPEFSESTVVKFAAEHEYALGEEYYLTGSVTNIIKGERYQAAVHGRKRYTVRIWEEFGDLKTECSCPHRGRGVCRHAVALMLTIARQNEAQAPFKWFDLGERSETPHHDVPHPEAAAPLPTPERGLEDKPKIEEEAAEEAPLELLLARDIMTGNLVTLSPQASLVDAWDLICKKRFRHIPVVSGEGKLVGIISDRDLLLRAALAEASGEQRSSTVSDIMKTKILTASPFADIRHIARVLFEHRVGAMPIVDEQERLSGLITRVTIPILVAV